MSESSTATPADTSAGVVPLTDAEMRIARESLGLTAEQVAERLEVALRTVRRWEAGHSPVPAGVAATIGEWTDQQDAQAAAWIKRLADVGEPVLAIPRVEDRGGWPAGWWRALAGLVVAELPGVRVMYDDSRA